jgi:hypothetical protein
LQTQHFRPSRKRKAASTQKQSQTAPKIPKRPESKQPGMQIVKGEAEKPGKSALVKGTQAAGVKATAISTRADVPETEVQLAIQSFRKMKGQHSLKNVWHLLQDAARWFEAPRCTVYRVGKNATEAEVLATSDAEHTFRHTVSLEQYPELIEAIRTGAISVLTESDLKKDDARYSTVPEGFEFLTIPIHSSESETTLLRIRRKAAHGFATRERQAGELMSYAMAPALRRTGFLERIYQQRAPKATQNTP